MIQASCVSLGAHIKIHKKENLFSFFSSSFIFIFTFLSCQEAIQFTTILKLKPFSFLMAEMQSINWLITKWNSCSSATVLLIEAHSINEQQFGTGYTEFWQSWNISSTTAPALTCTDINYQTWHELYLELDGYLLNPPSSAFRESAHGGQVLCQI